MKTYKASILVIHRAPDLRLISPGNLQARARSRRGRCARLAAHL
ncbi:MAG: hypothetical protein ACLPYB_15045 [Desulfobaccales bacterium]